MVRVLFVVVLFFSMEGWAQKKNIALRPVEEWLEAPYAEREEYVVNVVTAMVDSVEWKTGLVFSENEIRIFTIYMLACIDGSALQANWPYASKIDENITRFVIGALQDCEKTLKATYLQ